VVNEVFASISFVPFFFEGTGAAATAKVVFKVTGARTLLLGLGTTANK